MRSLLFKLLSLLAVVAVIYYVRYYSDILVIKKDSAAFVVDTIDNLAMHEWNPQEFAANADPAAVSGKDINAIFKNYNALGRLRRNVVCDIQDYTSYHYPSNVVYVGTTYQCEGLFEKGKATMMVTLYRFSNNRIWKIRSFDLYSSALPPLPAPKPATPVGSGQWK